MNSFEYKEAVEKAVGEHNFHEAFRLLRVMLPGESWGLRSELDSIEQDYRRLLDYALSGAPDPGRGEQLSALAVRIYGLLDMLLRESLVPEHSTLYFNVVRTLRMRRGESLPSLLREYSAAAGAVSSFALASIGRVEAERRRRTLEDLEQRVFERLWVTVPLGVDDVDAIRTMMAADDTPEAMKQLAVSALTLSLLQFFNESTLKLLLDFAAPELDDAVAVRAEVGAVLVMARWPRRSDSARLRARLDALREGQIWSADVEQILMQIIRMADVDKISRTMRDEIIPEMMKLRPDIEKHIREVGADVDPEVNPEWEELLERSGLTERLRKLSEMQMNGGDLFYTAFSQLKGYPFFSHISHWFLPFEPDRLDVAAALGHDTALGLMMADAPTICNSDKYSFVLSIDRLPEQQKQMVLRQLGDAQVNMAEALGAELLPEQARRRDVMVRYVQDLFRFFRLFRRCGEFYNPFATLINPAAIPALEPDFSAADKLRLLGEFCFKHGHMAEALDLFRRLEPDLTLHQKMGHALRRLGRLSEALTELERAEMLAPESAWTLRHLAQLNKQLGRYDRALEYYDRIERLEPDNPATALAMGHCHLQLNRLREALHCYYKAEMLDEASTKPLRPIAWCAFLNGDLETARAYYTRVMRQLTPTPADYLNMGHLELASGDIRQAINFYKLNSPDSDALGRSLADDLPLLEKAGVDTSLIPLILDNIRYEND